LIPLLVRLAVVDVVVGVSVALDAPLQVAIACNDVPLLLRLTPIVDTINSSKLATTDFVVPAASSARLILLLLQLLLLL
jgi:hypothetical protein